MVDVTYIIIAIAVEPVVMRVAAIIVAELFVGPAVQISLAAETGFGGGKHAIV